MRQFKIAILILAAATLSGCATQAVIADLEDDKVIVQAQGNDMTVINAEAQRGCQMHGKTARQVSKACLNGWCTAANYLYACQ